MPSSFIAQGPFDMLAWCEAVLNLTSPPSVLSISWGAGESGYDAAHMRAADACFQRAAVGGLTLLAASGDAGTGRQGGPCATGGRTISGASHAPTPC